MGFPAQDMQKENQPQSIYNKKVPESWKHPQKAKLHMSSHTKKSILPRMMITIA